MDNGWRISLRSVFVLVAVACIFFACVKFLLDAVTDARRAAIDSTAQSPLNQIMLAMRNYEERYGTFPPAYIPDSNGKPMHSWRVLLLPFVEESALHEKYDYNEPWNGPNNIKLLDQMPTIFHSASEPESTRFTNIVVIKGKDTAFPYARPTTLSQFADGFENTILATEVANSKISWLEPRDLDVKTMSFRINDEAKPSISAVRWRLPYVVFADSIKAYRVDPTISPKSLKALTTIAGGEDVSRGKLVSEGLLE